MLRHALRADLPGVVTTWVDAFSTDPFFRWIAPDDDTFHAFATDWMTMVAGLCFERGHTYLTDAAAVAWVPPDIDLVGPDQAQRARDIIAGHTSDAKADEALRVILSARGLVMQEPHWVLQYVGVRSADQGSGLGAAVVNIGLATADRDGLPCGLISTNARNLPFYARLGFTMTGEAAVPGTDVALRPMTRPAGKGR